MKKTLLATAMLSVLMTGLISCGTTKEVQSAPDSYISEEEMALASPETEGLEKAEGEAASTPAPAAKTKKKKNAFEDFFTFGNKDDYIIYDQTTVFTKELTGLTEKNANVAVRCDNQMAGFGCYNTAVYYYVQFDKENRAALARAVEAYFSDFENKRLNRRGKRTDRAYGKLQYRLDWGSLSSSTPNNGSGEGFCGYEFVKGSPYFTLYNYEFENNYYEIAGDATSRKSNFVKFYFTKSQLRQLLSMLSEDTIQKQLIDNDPDFIYMPTTVDEY